MNIEALEALRPELEQFALDLGACIKPRPSRNHLRHYLAGQLSDLPRKSTEPIALMAGIGPSIRILTVAGLIAVLRELDPPHNESVFAIALSGWEGGPSAFALSTRTEGASHAKVYTARLVEGRWNLRHTPRAGGVAYSVWDDLPTPLDMVTALHRSTVDRGMSIKGVTLSRFGSAGDPIEKRINMYRLGDAGPGAGMVIINAADGAVVDWDALRAR